MNSIVSQLRAMSGPIRLPEAPTELQELLQIPVQ
jgi:hypothetical protein